MFVISLLASNQSFGLKDIKIEKKEILVEHTAKSAEDILKKVELVYKNAKNFQARYQQKVKKPNPDKENLIVLQSTGKFFRLKEYSTRSKKWKYQALWDIESPVNYQVITNFESLWLYNPVALLVQTQSYQSLSPASLFMNDLLMGKLNLSKNYSATLSLEHSFKIELVPKNQASSLRLITLKVHPLSYWVEELWIGAHDDSTYELLFTNAQKDMPHITDLEKVFTKSNLFNIPQGVMTTH